MTDFEVTPLAARFSESAHRYEQDAVIQEEAAIRFDAWLAGQSATEPERIAEIGCGTGFLTRRLRARFPRSLIYATDLAPAMVDHCRSSMQSASGLQFAVKDGRHAIFDSAPDWIVSAMCFQWFHPLQPVLKHHLAQCKALAFSIMLDGSFSVWRAAHAQLGLVPGLHQCPNYEQLLQTCRLLGASRICSERVWLHQHHVNGLSFAKSLRSIGADQPRTGHAPVNLKPVFRLLDKGFDADYEIGFFYVEK